MFTQCVVHSEPLRQTAFMGRVSIVSSVALVPICEASGAELLEGTEAAPFSTSVGVVRGPVICRTRICEEDWRETRNTPPELPNVTQGWIAPSQGKRRQAVTVPMAGVAASSGALSTEKMLIWFDPPTM